LGRLIPTGADFDGHSAEFSYGEREGIKICILTCTCGFQAELKAWDKPWGVKEAEVRFQEHLDPR
jgi:hypothetical protein